MKFYRQCLNALPAVVTIEQKVDLLYQVQSLIARKLMNKHLGTRHDDLPTFEHVANAFFDPVVAMAKLHKTKLPATPWTLKVEAEGAVAQACLENAPGAPAVAQACRKTLQPKIIRYGADGVAIESQDVAIETVSKAPLDWETGMSRAEASKAPFAMALAMVSRELLKDTTGRVGMTRSSKGEVKVVALQDLKLGSVAFAPAGPDGENVSICSASKEYKPPYLVIGNLAIAPVTRLPPSKVDVADWKKDVFVNPYWAMERSPVSETANMSESCVAVEGVMNMTFTREPMDLRRASAVATSAIEIPVLTNHKDIKQGDELIVEVAHQPKPEKVPKTVSWHQLTKK